MALLTILNTFNMVSNLGVYHDGGGYDPEVEHVLRINLAGRKFMMGGRGGVGNTSKPMPIIHRALWPFILERARYTSATIYDASSSSCSMEEKEYKKCGATGLFHLIRYGPLFVEDNWRQCCDDSNREIAAAATSSSLNCDDDASTNKALKRKRKRKRKRRYV